MRGMLKMEAPALSILKINTPRRNICLRQWLTYKNFKMASVSESSTRANIRIEIKNDFTEEMDVDEENNTLSDVEIEDGEISDGKSADDVQETQTRKLFTNRNTAVNRVENQWQNSDGGFTTGVDIFAKDEQDKLQTRASRFGINPEDFKSLTDEQLQNIHDSLGITEEEEINTRFEAIHMYGTKELSTQDVFGYFGKYGPSSIEWINDESCNVVWIDKVSAARAFHGLSRAVEGMPVTGKCDPFQDDKDSEIKSTGRSILLKEREVVLSDDGKEMEKVHVSDINIPIPPGYWRLGEPHPKAKYILLRFAKRTDKKPLKAEKFSEYYRKYGNPNFGGIKGLISESKKKRMKGILPEEKVPSGNPWGSLAKNWNNDPLELVPETEEQQVPYQPKKVSKSILNRLGTNKRTHQSEPEEEEDEKPEPKKSKVPRMRMYADEEEARIEKVKQMKKLRKLEQIEEKMATTIPDLRNRIGRHALPTQTKIPQVERIPPVKLHPVRIEVTRRRSEEKEISDHSEDEDIQQQQRSKVTVIVKKPSVSSKPTVASTIWSRLDLEKRKQIQQKTTETVKSDSESKSDSSKSDSSSSESDSDEEYSSAVRNKISKAVNSRPGFNRDLKSRLGLNTDHKSPLRIEINNDHYKK